jgi:DNA-binding CsgD family transcriptional regulator
MGLSGQQRKLVDDVKVALGSSLDIRQVLKTTYPLLQRVVPADYAALGITAPGNPGAFDWLVADMPLAFFRAYPELAQHDFVLQAVMQAPNRVRRDCEMLSRRDLEANVLYRRAGDLGIPLEQVMSAMLHVDGDWASGISLYRAERRPFSEQDQETLQDIIPAFGNAVRNCRAFGQRACRGELLEGILSSEALPTLLLEPPAREVSRTAAATRLLEKWFRPSERQHGLPDALQAYLLLLARAENELPPNSYTLRRGPAGELAVNAHRVSSPGASYLALVLREVPRSGSLPGAWSERLTPRELEVAEQVAEGLDNQSIAEFLGVTLSTLKKHVTSVFNKLGVDSRAQLIAHARRPPT